LEISNNQSTIADGKLEIANGTGWALEVEAWRFNGGWCFRHGGGLAPKNRGFSKVVVATGWRWFYL
jgi:hypothetical protein